MLIYKLDYKIQKKKKGGLRENTTKSLKVYIKRVWLLKVSRLDFQ